MPTPSSGTISMLDMRNEITRGSGSISMSDIRTRYDSTGAISFSTLYKVEGFEINQGEAGFKSDTARGWTTNGPGAVVVGSVTPNENSAQPSDPAIQVAANSWIWACSTFVANGVPQSNTYLNIANAVDAVVITDPNPTTEGFRSTDVTRVVIANTARTFSSVSNYQVELPSFQMANTGTVTALVKF